MNKILRQDSEDIVRHAIDKVKPNKAVKEALKKCHFNNGRVILIAIGKAAVEMARAVDIKVDTGIIITKYGYGCQSFNNIECYEAGHPIVDENSINATKKAINLVSDLKENDNVLFLLSGGGSALFEVPLISLEELQDINNQLIKCGANIEEINTIRKRLSDVKGGRFGKLCYPAKVFNIVLSDVVGDRLDMVASGPTVIDTSTSNDALDIVHKYHLNISKETKELLNKETIKELNNVESYVCGDVSMLAKYTKEKCEELGYRPVIINDQETSDIEVTKNKFIKLIKEYKYEKEKLAFIITGEITVEVKGQGLGGRNEQLALELAKELKDTNASIICVGSDGTDGPTDAAGGYADGDTSKELEDKGINIDDYIKNNDAYHALKEINNLIITGPTGTNVNDVYLLLIKN